MAKDIQEIPLQVYELEAYNAPTITEDTDGKFVKYGEDNNYFGYLYERFLNSPTNNALINGITKYIYGKGIDATDSIDKPSQYAKLLTMIKPTCLRNIITDRKILGMGAFLVYYENKKPSRLQHIPMMYLRSGKLNKGVVKEWFYDPNIQELDTDQEPKESFATFGHGNQIKPEIYVIKRYMPNMAYYPPVEYQGGLPYAVLEEEIHNYLINDAKNHFSGTKVINVNSNIPDKKKRMQIKNDILNTTTGSNGQKVIVGFSKGKDNLITVQDISLDNAPEHYKYLSEESFEKLLVAHGVTSPMLVGVRNGNSGLGNNADEIKNATLLFDNTVIRTFQDEIIDALTEVLAQADISLNLYFKTIQPIEFTDTEKIEDEVNKEEETGVKMSEIEPDEYEQILESLEGEILNEEWELVDAREYEEGRNPKLWASEKIKPTKLTMLSNFIKQKANSKSDLDKSIYKVRFQYKEKYSSKNSRDFCSEMMKRTAKGVVYRKEDIDQASFRGVNKKFGHQGRPYSLFKYKGGPQCGHIWEEQLYRLKKKTEGSFYEDKSLSSSMEVGSIPKSYRPSGESYEKAKKAPKDMPNNGHHPNFKK